MWRHDDRRRIGAMVALAAVALVASAYACQPGRPDSDRITVATAPDQPLAQALHRARLATIRYATDLSAARLDGYTPITPMMPGVGVYYLDAKVRGFDLERPPMLVYVGHGAAGQLGALAWLFPRLPESPPLPGATYGVFEAACHYRDGWLIAGDEPSCEPNHPITNAPLLLWRPRLYTLHLWLWYPNPDGLYHTTNPFIHAGNA